MERPAQDYLPDQCLIDRKIKIKGSLLSRDSDQVEVTTKKVEGTIVKTTELNKQEGPEAKHLLRQPRRTTLTKTTVGKKGVLNQNTQKPERTIDSPILQTDLLQYDYLTSSSRPTTLNMMARPNQKAKWLKLRLSIPAESKRAKKCLSPPMRVANKLTPEPKSKMVEKTPEHTEQEQKS